MRKEKRSPLKCLESNVAVGTTNLVVLVLLWLCVFDHVDTKGIPQIDCCSKICMLSMHTNILKFYELVTYISTTKHFLQAVVKLYYV